MCMLTLSGISVLLQLTTYYKETGLPRSIFTTSYSKIIPSCSNCSNFVASMECDLPVCVHQFYGLGSFGSTWPRHVRGPLSKAPSEFPTYYRNRKVPRQRFTTSYRWILAVRPFLLQFPTYYSKWTVPRRKFTTYYRWISVVRSFL